MDDNAANTTVADSAGSNDGTFSDATGNPNTDAHHSTDAVEGTGSLEFDGVDDYVTLPRNDIFERGNILTYLIPERPAGWSWNYQTDYSTNALTVSAWIKHDTSADNNATIIGTGTGGWFLGTLGTADTISFVCSLADPNGMVSETITVTNPTPVFDNQWHYVIGVFDGYEAHLYVDDSHESAETTLLAAVIENGGDNAVLIGENAGSTGSHWKGLIDDVRIYGFAFRDEVFHYYHPKYAWDPAPFSGAQDEGVEEIEVGLETDTIVSLSWLAGDGADSHDLYFGKALKADIYDSDSKSVDVDDLTLLASGWLGAGDGADLADPNDVVDFADFAVLAEEWGQTSLVYQGNIADPNFDPNGIEYSSVYYWRVDEIDDDTSTTYTGKVWSFTTEEETP
jgi:hypothetical protein